MQLQTDLLQWNGVTSLQLSDPTEPREGSKFWLLDFDAMVEDDSLLGRALAEQRRRRQIFTGQAPDDAPLTLQLLNAATNVLLNLPERSPLIERLHLERFNIVLDPTSGNYGVGATFRF